MTDSGAGLLQDRERDLPPAGKKDLREKRKL